MLIFWLWASLMVAVALALLVPSLLGRQGAGDGPVTDFGVALFRDRLAILETERHEGELAENDFQEARRELERELLAEADEAPPQLVRRAAASPMVAVAVAVFVPLMAFSLYFHLGTPQALEASPGTPVAQAAARGQIPHSLEEMVAQLEERLVRNPDDADGWVMLGRSYAAFNRLEEARDAFRKAGSLRPDDPLTLVAHAETLAGLQGNRLEGEPERFIRRALVIDPNFPRALWLAGVMDFRSGNRAAAAASWQRLLDQGGLNEEQTRRVQQAIANAGVASATPPSRATAGTATGRSPAAAPATLRVLVDISPELAARASPTDMLFVFARAEQGPPMPLAVSRHRVAELPLTVTLDDSMAITPQLRLSMFPSVTVGARISKSSSATPSPGDLQGRSAPLSPAGETPVAVTIDRITP